MYVPELHSAAINILNENEKRQWFWYIQSVNTVRKIAAPRRADWCLSSTLLFADYRTCVVQESNSWSPNIHYKHNLFSLSIHDLYGESELQPVWNTQAVLYLSLSFCTSNNTCGVVCFSCFMSVFCIIWVALEINRSTFQMEKKMQLLFLKISQLGDL